MQDWVLDWTFNQIFQENKNVHEFKVHKVQLKSDEVGAKNSLKLEFVLHFSLGHEFLARF